METTKVKITKVRDGSFNGGEGEPIEWYWIKAIFPDGVTREFGSRTSHDEGAELELKLEKREDRHGKIVWREVA